MDADASLTLESVGQRLLLLAIAGGIEMQFGLRLGGTLPYTLRIERPFSFRDALGETSVDYRDSTEQGLAILGRVGATLGSYCTHAVMEPEESLRVQFSNGSSLYVPVDPQFEAWTFTGPEGVLVSHPGGAIPPAERQG